jgi:hypothetical protein
VDENLFIMEKFYHTITYNGHWAVQSMKNPEPTKLFDTQADAWHETVRLARISKGEAVLHADDGQVLVRESYMNHLFPKNK